MRLPDFDTLRYAEATDWWGLVMVFTKWLADSSLDEIILLLHSRAPKYQGWVSRYVRTVMYGSIEEIPDRLRAKAASYTDPHAPVDSSPNPPPPSGHQAELENDDGQQKLPVLPEEDVLNQSGGEAPVDNGGQEDVPASPEEIQAVLVIGSAYRRVITRKKEVLKGIGATRARFWSLLRDRASSMKWSRHRGYIMLMQGPLVHVLVCLDCIKMFADHIKKDTKKQLQVGDHMRLEELIERSDRSR
jgi:hypothetical protein